MILDAAYVRFFRSLNYDYLRKTDNRYQPDPWDVTPDGMNYPFVEVSLEPDITTVVGANESGKSQLLEVLKQALTGQGIVRGDFCRYSRFFSRDSRLTMPEFGLRFTHLSAEERQTVASMCELETPPTPGTIALFRMNDTPKVRVYVREGDAWTGHHVKKPKLLESLGLPAVFEIDAGVPLPDAVPLAFLATGDLSSATGRDKLRASWDAFQDKGASWFQSEETVTASARAIAAAFAAAGELDETIEKQYKLARDLLVGVAGLDADLFEELRVAVRSKNGYAKSIVDTVNAELAKSLNFPHWWSQDSNFELFVELREYDLIFMIRDRTGTSYSFDERSEGLKYFLSYFVQFKSHEPREDGRPELLLMDEPDAYLSSSGQQDLLRIFEAFAAPDDPEVMPIQVVYVTHSPFLIDKNHAARIRVLEKGEHDEGTRVVANASRNHYEPLRSALGSFVGETAFIGSCNLLLEGPSDQILLAGISTWLRDRDAPRTERLDLNTIALVPSGGADQIPYLAFLARGRDVDRPAIVVLLDGDSKGDEARKALQRSGPRRKQVVAPEFVMQLSDDVLEAVKTANPAGRQGIEDLIPLSLVIRAAKAYCDEFVPDVDPTKMDLKAAKVFADQRGTLKGVEAAIKAQLGDEHFHLDKIGFARNVVAVLRTAAPGDEAAELVESNFRVLLSQLGRMQRAANRDASREKIRSRLNRIRRRFEADHQHGARRESVILLVEEIDSQLDTGLESEEVRAAMRSWTSKHQLDEDPRGELDDFAGFLLDLQSLPYAGARSVQDPSLQRSSGDDG